VIGQQTREHLNRHLHVAGQGMNDDGFDRGRGNISGQDRILVSGHVVGVEKPGEAVQRGATVGDALVVSWSPPRPEVGLDTQLHAIPGLAGKGDRSTPASEARPCGEMRLWDRPESVVCHMDWRQGPHRYWPCVPGTWLTALRGEALALHRLPVAGYTMRP
jgi:hypothetical protein